jgi:DNA-binding transcriptional MocR family regulator
MTQPPAHQETQVQPAPGVVDLGIGQPQDAILPVDLITRAMRAAGAGGHQLGLQYGPERGAGFARAALADFLAEQYGLGVDAGQLMISNGTSQAIDLCCAALTRPGDVVFVEDPTYFFALRIFADHGLRVVGIAVDDEGLRLDDLEAQLARYSPRMLYVIASGQNPTGASMPTERRRRLVELAREHDFLVLADEVYQLLHYTGSAPEPLAAHVDSGVVVSLGTFSKILAPGLRLGWIQSSENLLDALASRGQLISGGGLNPFTSALIASVVRDGGLVAHLEQLRRTLYRRLTTMDEALQAHLPAGVTYRRPDAGYFFWLRGAESFDATAFLPVARAAGAGFQPGPVCSPGGRHTNCLRLSFAFYDEPELTAAVASLGSSLTGFVGATAGR